MSTYGVNYISYTRGLSGIRFNSPVSFPRIEMEEINIGDSNSITGYTTGINVGSRNLILSNQSDASYTLINLTGITGTAPGQTPFTGITGQRLVFIGSLAKKRNANFGYENSTDNGGEVYNFGSSNRNFSGLNLVQIGVNSNSSYTNNGAIVGIGNTSSSGNNISILGNSNNVNKFNKINLIGNFNQSNSYAGNIFGNQNNLLNGIEGSVTVLGNANQLKNTNSSNILGDINNISGAGDLYVAGNNNTNISNNDILVLGKNNSILRAQDQIIVGNSITSQDSNSNILFGKNITSKNQNNISFGASNTIDGNNQLVYGKSNSLNFSSNADFILGVNNLLSGTYSNTIIGSDNHSDRFLLDSLYLIGLTGVTGSGQALFTGVTGYIMGGGYGASGVDIVGGNQNFIVGENNLTTLNYGAYTFGNDNRLLDNLNTYVIGANNLSEKSNTSYVFGESNSIGGFKNYIIGNNNIVRTGDYNSVFIGIGYEDILNPKNNSVNIASFDNTIEVSSNDIKLVSSNRPTINNENIIVTSDLNSYLNDSNGLPNSGEVTINNDNTLTDASYHGYPNQIKIGTFSFDGRETWEPTPFSGYAESWMGGPKAFTNGYFRKINSKYYQTIGGFNTITGNYYYTSNDNAWNMLYTFDLTANGNWIITNVNDDNVYFYHASSRNSGVLPLTDWTTMSESDELNPWGNQAYGLDPAPTITYLSPETSKNITGEKINPGNWNSSYFNSYGKKAYISDAQGVSIIYGNHSDPKFDPTWLIVDNYSSGIYGINDSSDFFNFPQGGWQSTGFANYTGFNFSSDPFIKISLSKSGVLSSSDPVLGKIYIPFVY